MVTIGDCILDSSGVIGVVVDTGVEIKYKTYSSDGLEFYFCSPNSMLLQMSDRFKKAWLREIRMIERRNNAEDGTVESEREPTPKEAESW